MGWSATSRSDLTSFPRLLAELKRARSPLNGRKVSTNTRIRLVDGTLDDPKTIAVRLYATDILTFYVDGSIDVAVHGWGSSATTNAHLWGFAHVHTISRKVPPVNGYKTFPDKVTVLSRSWNTPGVAYCTRGHKDIRILPDGSFDMTTVTPHTVQVVSEPAKLRKVMKHLGNVVKLARGYAKLCGNNPFEEYKNPLPCQWLLERYKTPLEKIELAPFPRIMLDTYSKRVFGKTVYPSMENEFKKALADVRHDIARYEGWLEPREVFLIE